MDFSVLVQTSNITNQKQSGRCWMFSTLNVLRERVIRQCKLEDFSISPTYLAFYDKLEKANLFFENILHFAAQELDDRETFTLLENPAARWRPVGYGGQPHQKVRRRALLGDAGDGALHRHGRSTCPS